MLVEFVTLWHAIVGSNNRSLRQSLTNEVYNKFYDLKFEHILIVAIFGVIIDGTPEVLLLSDYLLFFLNWNQYVITLYYTFIVIVNVR